jgi:hypothetical protein
MILSNLGMELSPEKSSKEAQPVTNGFEFLGISISPGKIRPSIKAKTKFLVSIERAFEDACKAFVGVRSGQDLPRSQSLISTLKRVDGMIDGWGKHYWFCNDEEFFKQLDKSLTVLVKGLLGAYRDTYSKLPIERRELLLGLCRLGSVSREPFSYPKVVTINIP